MGLQRCFTFNSISSLTMSNPVSNSTLYCLVYKLSCFIDSCSLNRFFKYSLKFKQKVIYGMIALNKLGLDKMTLNKLELSALQS